MRALLDLLRPGARVYLPGATGEIAALADALAAEPERMKGVHVISCLLPGINGFDYAALAPSARVTAFLPSDTLAASVAAGRVRIMPLSYTGIARWLQANPVDIAVAHLALPGADGSASFGICADFSPIAWAGAQKRVAVVNRAMPAMKRGPRVAVADADLLVEVDSPLIEVAPPPAREVLAAIGRSVAALIPDDVSIQLGLGGAPAAIADALVGHTGIRLHSGLAPEAVRNLGSAHALAPGRLHVAGIAAGSADYYEWLAKTDLVAFADTIALHASVPAHFHAINSAIEVDLFGQANLEWLAGRAISGPGGAPDFARAALTSPGGRSIVALPSKSRGATRIVARLSSPAVSLPRTDADIVVTEYGVAELAQRSADERAEALIAIAAPEFRNDLSAAWHEMRS